jgi:plastocyanin
MRFSNIIIYTSLCLPTHGVAQQNQAPTGHQGHQMAVDPAGVVMNENQSTLPRNCTEISRDYDLTIYAGRKYAANIPGMIFGMSEHEVLAEPCSRITVTFINEDKVRHQWMVHGLPKYLYPAGMFHIEASGGQSKTGTFIVPADDQTYLIHCDMAQHMEKGMRGQLVIGAGSGDLWGVAGISDQFFRYSYLPRYVTLLAGLMLIVSFLVSLRLLKKR